MTYTINTWRLDYNDNRTSQSIVKDDNERPIQFNSVVEAKDYATENGFSNFEIL